MQIDKRFERNKLMLNLQKKRFEITINSRLGQFHEVLLDFKITHH